MSWDTDLEELMPHTITIEDVAGRNANGEPNAWAAAIQVKCSIQGPVKFMHRATNQQLVSAQTLYCSGAAALTTFQPDARLTLPAGFLGTTTPVILQVDRESDNDGFYNHTIYLG